MAAALEHARELGFLGEGDLGTQLRHAAGFADAAAAAGLTGGPASVLDLGSGGGVPGLVLAAIWPESRMVLLDANARRCAALRDAVASCGWSGRVEVVEERAEQAGRDPHLRGSIDLVVARSFGPPAVVAECAAPLLAVGGLLIVSEPPPEPPPEASTKPAPKTWGPSGEAGPGPTTASREPSRWPAEALAQLGLQPVLLHRGEFGYQVLRQDAPCPDRFPRRVGVPAKRPLY